VFDESSQPVRSDFYIKFGWGYYIVAYMLELLASMRVHNMFHVSLLKKYVPDPNHIIDWNVI
jgi:hypothetical protein